ncbi:bifunctional adenosylcobinamide kinase/adenosylcobinamide-phosphate guanylyltransferase [Aurantimonas sp. A3-2-R12]|uniref:bifunctional adenosylcobinamide kinase/adenosylcobinamide-phosphate guanylyltransferase n=1 Tax=Aurantimonas sp. A3-2-R12 TaxID=3114362 RepID=UPI002E19160A|nr:bifunctional adenosylcobinamide kinase/adenosylcobinamide-phosphate guanylyltransferase [Aurantimonas sp. A3-2-R12]
MSPTLGDGVTLVLGGARSGKSALAERLAEASGLAPVYLATGRAFDAEMEARIGEHQGRRGNGWRTVEVPLDLVAAIGREAGPERVVLVDCLTLWLTNLMMERRPIAAECQALVNCLATRVPGSVILVSNEVGLGIVPENEMARDFRDHAGRLHQAVAAVAAKVLFVTAGLPMILKG